MVANRQIGDGPLVNTFDRVKETLSDVLRRVSYDDKQDEVGRVVEKASELALIFGRARCRLELFDAPVNHIIRTAQSARPDEQFSDCKEPRLSEGVVLLFVSPGLRRIGDGRGANLDQRTILCPADVFLQETGL